jgi:hypothetical protein
METIFEDTIFLVRVNSSGEIFVLHKINDVEIRISRWSDMIVYAWQNCQFTPTSKNGLSAFFCSPKA